MNERYNGKVTIHHLIGGAQEARGLAVIIDVFRAFSLECYLYDAGVREVRPVGSIDEAWDWRRRDPDCVLAGERKGKMCEGFDMGNAPSAADPKKLAGRRVIHTTSAGTQGIVNAAGADTLLTGALVNAKAVARYIMQTNPPEVSLVCMGRLGLREAVEDELCAAYIASILAGEPMPDIAQRVADLRWHGGEHFFDPDNQSVFPEPDFWLCTKYDRFDFVLRVEQDENGFISRRIEV